MKRFTLIAGVLLGAVALAGCVNEGFEKAKKGTPITLTASVENDNATRTDFTDPANPIWSAGDAIGVYFVSNDGNETIAEHIRMERIESEDFVTATFSGLVNVDNGEYTIYGYYPHGEAGMNTAHHAEAKIEIPAIQRPTATSFDPMADVMVMKPIVHNHAGDPISHAGLQFARTLGMIKLALNTEELEGQPVTNLTFTTNDATLELAGKAHFDLTNGQFGGFYEGATTTITAIPNGDILANGTDAFLLCMPVITLNEGTQITITGETDGYTFEKTVTMPITIKITAGNWLPININLDGCVTAKADLSYDETLNNQMSYEGKTYDIEHTYFFEDSGADWDDYAFQFMEDDSEMVGISMFVPKAKLGQEIPFVENEDEVDYWFVEFWDDFEGIYHGGNETSFNTIADGHMIITKEETVDGFATVTYKMSVLFTDGTVLKVNYSGLSKDMDAPGEDIMPGDNEWAYNGVITGISEAEYSDSNESFGLGTFTLYGDTGESVAALFLPLTMLDGREINLLTYTGIWQFDFYADYYALYFGVPTHSDPEGDMTKGLAYVTLDRDAETVTIVTDVVYNDVTHLRINYSGPISGLPLPTTNITSIDELVGDWNVSEGFTQDGQSYYNNPHVITITKIDENTIEIDNFTNGRVLFPNATTWGDKVTATINGDMEMILGVLPVVSEPGWAGYSATTRLFPFVAGNVQGCWPMTFPAQEFGKLPDGSIVMEMYTANYAFSGGPRLTYGVADATESGEFDGLWLYCVETVWTKPAPSAAPARVQAGNTITVPAITKKFDMRINPMPTELKADIKVTKDASRVKTSKMRTKK